MRDLKNIKILIPSKVQFIIHELERNGFEGYVVGGCLRDSILNREINDWDITTNAKPQNIIEIFNHTIPTGIKHGTITVLIDEEAFEVTTYRIDGEYIDNRHPSEVTFTCDIREDLSRRDFTINAMAYSEKNGLMDLFNGLEDLKKQVVRAVGDPLKRFNEDALRMMRAIRFASQLDFKIDDNTSKAILVLDENINSVSIERIRDEFNKIILSNVWYIEELINLGLLKEFLPELIECQGVDQQNIHHIFDVLTHILTSVNNIEKDLILRLTMVFHDICKPDCKTVDEKGVGHFYGHEEASFIKSFGILKRMKYDNDTINKVTTLIKYHDRDINSSKSIRKLLSIMGEELFRNLLKVKAADLSGQNPIYHKEGYDKLAIIEEKFNKILARKECFTIKDLEIDGKDLIEIGFNQGSDIGKTLNLLLEKVLEDPSINKKNLLIIIAKSLINHRIVL